MNFDPTQLNIACDGHEGRYSGHPNVSKWLYAHTLIIFFISIQTACIQCNYSIDMTSTSITPTTTNYLIIITEMSIFCKVRMGRAWVGGVSCMHGLCVFHGLMHSPCLLHLEYQVYYMCLKSILVWCTRWQ